MSEVNRDSEDFSAMIQAAMQAAEASARAAVERMQSPGGVTVSDNIPVIEGAAALEASSESVGGSSENAPYFVPGFGGDGGTASVMPGCFDVNDNYKFINKYYRVEQYIFEVTSDADITGAGLVYLSIEATNPGGATVSTVASVAAFNELLKSTSKALIPLYFATKLDDGGYSLVDLRNIPTAPAWNVYSIEDNY